jgi:hypothetical protein
MSMDRDSLIERHRRGSGAVRDADLAGQVRSEVDRRLQSLMGDAQRLVQVVEVLEGGRGDPLKAAARVGELASLPAMVPGEPKSRQAAAAPTQAEFNALVTDVHAIFDGINAIRHLLERRT